jgi:hypothetical protein
MKAVATGIAPPPSMGKVTWTEGISARGGWAVRVKFNKLEFIGGKFKDGGFP